jgi:sigma-E factor negative regulatory protein RseB
MFHPRPMPGGEEWRMQSQPGSADAGSVPSDWVVEQLPQGFRKLTEMRRTMPGKKSEVQHLVYSDGLAAVSVFVEPGPGTARQELSSQGAIHVYARSQGNYQVTVLGEVPRATVKQIGDSLLKRPAR